MPLFQFSYQSIIVSLLERLSIYLRASPATDIGVHICHATGYLNGSTHISPKNGKPRALSNSSHPYLRPRHLNDLKSYVVGCNTTISPSGNLEAIIGIRNPRIFPQALSTRYDNTTPTPTTAIL